MTHHNHGQARHLNPRPEEAGVVQAARNTGGTNLVAATLRVSETGACLVLTAPLPEQTEVDLTVYSRETTRQVQLVGKVDWCQPVGCQWVAHVHFEQFAEMVPPPSVN
jgi:hypothetical protein